ncbi:MAG: DUF333 domain-containing protein [Candidatus Paceibacterota bacterium]
MKKILKKSIIVFLFAACVFNFGFGVAPALAADNGVQIANPTLLPDSPFYFIKNIAREIQSFFTLDPVKKAELRLDFANQKITEAQKLSINKPQDQNNINKALANYQTEMVKLEKAVEVLKKDNPKNEKLLNQITAQTFNHQEILKSITNSASGTNTDQVQTEALKTFVVASYEIASPEKVKEVVKENINKDLGEPTKGIEKIEVLKQMEDAAPTELKKDIIEVQNDVLSENLNLITLSETQKDTLQKYYDELKNTDEYKQIVLEDFAKKIVSQNQEELKQLNNLSTEDQQKLQEFAKSLLTGETIDYNEALKGFNSLDISSQSKDLIMGVSNKIIDKSFQDGTAEEFSNATGLANPASVYCEKQGYKLDIRKDAQGNETGYCIFGNGQECEEWSFFRGECPANSSR